jgi:hypothetical protein
MKTLIQLILFTSLLLLLQAVSCKSPDDKKLDCNNNTMQLPQMAKDYFLFKDGSYWVYQNAINKQLDSFYISEFAERTGDNNQFKYGNKLTRCYEYYDYKLNGDLIGRITCVLYPLLPSNDRYYANQTFSYDEYNNKVTRQFFGKFTFIGDSLLRSDFVLGSTISMIDSFKINSDYYYNILSQTNTNLGIDYAKQSYFAKNVGLIKFTTNDNQTYELIKYHINQ